MMTQTHIKQHD